MKIKVMQKDYDEVRRLKPAAHRKPQRQGVFPRLVLAAASAPELKAVRHTFQVDTAKPIPQGGPCLFLMNHSSFTDLQIAATYLKGRPYHIVCTNDGFVGKEGLMRMLGCIPTRKFIPDLNLVRDMKCVFEELQESVLMYPEASYSFDGTETPLPSSLGKCIKLMRVPVVMLRTEGAFLRDPLYNCLQKRNVKVTTRVSCLLTADEIAELSAAAINDRLAEAFHYDHFREQAEQHITVSESFRADGLHRVLYKCPHCLTEGQMEGKGITLRCKNCGQEHELSETGLLQNTSGPTIYPYVSDWYRWERDCVREEILSGNYRLDAPVNIKMLVDLNAIYDVGNGRLTHDASGFCLSGCDGRLEYHQPCKVSYSVYSDYFWYEIGDMISIGDSACQYYCFPVEGSDIIAAKARLAAEELYKCGAKAARG